MRNLIYLLLCFTMLFFNNASASQIQNNAESEQKIRALFSHYLNRYNHYFMQSELLREPAIYSQQIMLLNNRGSNVLSVEQFNNQVMGFLDGLKKEGVSKLGWQDVNIRFLSSKVAVVSNIVVRFKPTGEIHNRIGVTYFVNKINEDWRISAFTVHNVENVIAS